MGTFHLVNITGISGWAVNGTHFIGLSHWKIPRKSGKSKKVGPFSRLEFPNRILCSIYTFLAVCTSSRSIIWSGTVTYRGLRPNGTTFYQSEISPLLPPKFPEIQRKLKMAKRIAMVSGIFLEGRRQTLLYSCK